MAGNIAGVTGFTGVRIGGGTAQALPVGVGSGTYGSDASEGIGKIWESFRTISTPVTATQNGSVVTYGTFPGAAVGDIVTAQVASSLSSGVGLVNAYVASANSIALVYSNASTAAATVAAHTVILKVERYGAF